MSNKQNYDEKQVIDRGKAFCGGYFAAVLTIVITYFIESVLEIEISGYSVFIVDLWVPLTVLMVLLILKDAYDGVSSATGMIFLSIMGACGVFILIVTAVKLADGSRALSENGVITDELGRLVCGACMTATGIIYWIKQRINKTKFGEE